MGLTAMSNIKKTVTFLASLFKAIVGTAILFAIALLCIKMHSAPQALETPMCPPQTPTLVRISVDTLNTFTLIPEQILDDVQREACEVPIRTFNNHQLVRKIKRDKAPQESCLTITYPNSRTPRQAMRVFKGVSLPSDCTRVAVFSRGYIPLSSPRTQTPRRGGGVHWVNRLVQNNILEDATWIAFDYDDEHGNFGQDADTTSFAQIIDAINTACPQAKIIVLGDCRGAHVALRYLAQHDNPSIDTLILESPYSSAEELFSTVSHSYLQPCIGDRCSRALLNKFVRWYFPYYSPQKDNLIAHIDAIKDKNIFIGHHMHDRVISDKNVLTLVEHLRKNNHVYLFASASNKGDHSRLSLIPSYQRAVNAFLKMCNLPHNTELAHQGIQFLEKSKKNGL